MEENKCNYCGDDCGNTCAPVKDHVEIIILGCIVVAGLGFILGILIWIK